MERLEQEHIFINNIIKNKKNLARILERIKSDRDFAMELKRRSLADCKKAQTRELLDFIYYINIYIELVHFELSEREKQTYKGVLYGFERFIASN